MIAEADGSEEEAATGQMLLREALSAGAEEVLTPSRPEEVAALWRWRDGIGIAADAYLGGKVSEDVCVPVERLAEVIAATHEAAADAQLEACCWGHAGDGNVHSSFLFDGGDAPRACGPRRPRSASSTRRSRSAARSPASTGSGSSSRRSCPAAVARGRRRAPRVKRLFDPKNLLNPGKKVA